MMQLLKITTTPMKYEMEVERPRLEYQQDMTPDGDITTEPSKLSVQTKNAEVLIDTYEARKSMGLTNIEDTAKKYAQMGKEHMTKLIGKYVDIGQAISQIQDGVEIGDVIRQKMLEQPSLYTSTLPAAPAEFSCRPATCDIDFEPGDVSIDWQIHDAEYVFMPGKVQMKIVEYPDIEIEYLGGPMYVPPSADPNYEEQADTQ